MRRALLWVGLAVGVALVAYAIFARKTDEEIIAEQLARLAAAVSIDSEENPLARGARLSGQFRDLFTPGATASVPELSAPVQGRRELVALATRAVASFRSLDVAFSGTSIEVGSAAANVTTTAKLNGVRTDGDFDRGERAVRLRWLRSEGDWKIDSVSVSEAD